MPTLEVSKSDGETFQDSADQSFPQVTREHVLNCSFDSWYSDYRSSALKSIILPLPAEAVAYLHEDGILLADDDGPAAQEEVQLPTTSTTEAPLLPQDEDSDSDEDEPPKPPPNKRFPDLHDAIKSAIAELGGEVVPKLNWSSPSDAKWFSFHGNTLMCKTPNDVYMLLKGSDAISRDLDGRILDGTVSLAEPPRSWKPVLVLQQFIDALNPTLEFRCFVKSRTLVAACQRDLIHNAHLEPLRPLILSRIDALFHQKLRYDFPDGNFVFDVWLPERRGVPDNEVLGPAVLMGINPWAPGTDATLFSWSELLGVQVPEALGTAPSAQELADLDVGASAGETTDEDEEDEYQTELRLVTREDAAAANLRWQQRSAQKLPLEVVEACETGGFRELADAWKELTERTTI